MAKQKTPPQLSDEGVAAGGGEEASSQNEEPNKEKPPKKNRALEYLRQAIFSRQLKPGAVISAQAISTELHMSRTPAREALVELAAGGFVELVGLSGAVVRAVTTENFFELLTLRYAIETQVAQKLAADLDEYKLQAIDRLLEAMRTASNDAERSDKSRWDYYQLDIKFHQGLAQLAGMSRAEAFVTNLMEHHRLFAIRHRGDPVDVLGEHENIVTAIKDYQSAAHQGSLKKIRKAVRKHMCGTVTRWAPQIVPWTEKWEE